MGKKKYEPNDPMELVGIEMNCDEGDLEEMTRCFVEEFIQLGYPDERILHFFRNPFYAGTHLIFLKKGEGFVLKRIEEARIGQPIFRKK